MSTLLKTEHLKKYYGKKKIVKAVDDVSLEIHAGSSMALIGESGSGKTTFGKLIAGLEKADRRKVLVPGTGNAGFVRKAVPSISQESSDGLSKQQRGI